MIDKIKNIKNVYKQKIIYTTIDDHTIEINQGSQLRNRNLFKVIRRLMKIGLPVDELIDYNNYSYLQLTFAPDDEEPNLIITHKK